MFDDVTIAFVGKYTDMQDSYMSVVKSLEHSAFRCNRKLIIKVCVSLFIRRAFYFDLLQSQWVDASDLEPETQVTNPAKYHDAWKSVVSAK